MKRSQVTDGLERAWEEIQTTITRSPMKSVAAAFVLGMLSLPFARQILTLLVLVGVLLAVWWFVSEPEDEKPYQSDRT